MSKAGKQISKEEKKQVKTDCAVLRKLLTKHPADKMTAQNLSELKTAMAALEQSSANVCRLAEG